MRTRFTTVVGVVDLALVVLILSSTHVHAVLTQPVVNLEPTNGLVGYWPGNNSAEDFSSLGNNGVFNGSYAAGRTGGDAAFNLDGINAYIPNNQAYDDFHMDSGWTVGFWFNPEGQAPNGDVFIGQDNGSGFQPKWFIDYGYTVFGSNSSFVWHVNDSNQERIFLLSDPVTYPTGWSQLTVVTDNINRVVTFYLNGQSIGSDPLPDYVLETNAQLILGGEEGLNFNGLMNEVVLYDRALSPQEVAWLANSTEPVPEPSSALFLCGLAWIGGLKRIRKI